MERQPLKVIAEERPDVVALGYDQDVDEEALKRELARLGLRVKAVRIPAFKPLRYKSSLVKNKIASAF